MIVVGFSWPVGHDNSVAAIVDGKLVFASEEERFTRHKHSLKEAPMNAFFAMFDFLEKNYRIKPQDISTFAVNWQPGLLRPIEKHRTMMHSIVVTQYATGLKTGSLLIPILKTSNMDLCRLFLREVYRKRGLDLPGGTKIYPLEHHLAHAASGYYFSGRSTGASLVVDGTGENESTTVWKVTNGEFEKVLGLPTERSSIGIFYEIASEAIKFNRLEGPGKVMGLAPYGAYSKKLDNRIKYLIERDVTSDVPYRFRERSLLLHLKEDTGEFYRRTVRKLSRGEDLHWNARGGLIKPVVDFAWCIQHTSEILMTDMAKWAKEHTGEKNLNLSGGVALNAKSNMEVYYSHLFNDIFIFPAANDAGGPIGAAAYVYDHVLGQKMKHGRLRNIYLGPQYDADAVGDLVKASKMKSEYIGDDVGVVARLAARGNLIGWFQGRAELGPRALGNRSIVADPTRKDMWKIVNSIKGREWWRPLAPSTMRESMKDYFVDPTDHEFMILMMKFNEEGSKRLPAVCHVDMTARPQSVDRRENKNWHKLIKTFKEIKGVGTVVNTSFNLAGEPLVETPKDAIRSFALGGFDALYIEGWLVKKR